MALNKDSLTASYGLWNYYLMELNETYKDSLMILYGIYNDYPIQIKILRYMKLI